MSKTSTEGILFISAAAIGVISYAALSLLEMSEKLTRKREETVEELMPVLRRRRRELEKTMEIKSSSPKSTRQSEIEHMLELLKKLSGTEQSMETAHESNPLESWSGQLCGSEDVGYVVYMKKNKENNVIYLLCRTVTSGKNRRKEKIVYTTDSLRDVATKYVKYTVKLL